MRIVVFSGTTEGRDFSRAAAALGIAVAVSVATDLGAEEQGQAPGITVHSGRLLPGAMAELLQGAALCVDATHPYAVEATKNIRAAANAALCRRVLELDAYRAAHTLLLYAAFGGEADLAAVAAEAARQGKTVAYPVCGEGFSLTAAVPDADGWAVGQYGIRAPVPERSALLQPEQLDLVLVPCTAFDAGCYRVGMGKGYYDRYLPYCTRAVKIGIALEVQSVPRAAVDAHDQRLDAFVTERGIYTWK